MTSDQAHQAEFDANAASAPAAEPDVPSRASAESERDAEQESWRRRGLALDEWIERVLCRAADRRELAEFEAGRGNVEAAQMLMRSALARELYVASMRGEQAPEEERTVRALLPTWTGASSAELLGAVRAVLGEQTEGL